MDPLEQVFAIAAGGGGFCFCGHNVKTEETRCILRRTGREKQRQLRCRRKHAMRRADLKNNPKQLER